MAKDANKVLKNQIKTILRLTGAECRYRLLRPDNVVELMANKVQKLRKNTQAYLKIASCIGNQFDTETLAMFYCTTSEDIRAKLWEALAEGLILPLGEAYKFAHDRIQQAAYSLIREKHKQAVHWQIGRTLLDNTPLEHLEQNLFAIVDQLNASFEWIDMPSEQRELAQLNMRAGRKASASAAYQLASDYLIMGIFLLDENNWHTQYDLNLELYVEAAETAYLSGSVDQMEHCVEMVLQQAKTLFDKVKIYEIKIQSYIAQNRMVDAVEMALQVLKLLGISLPKKPKKWHFRLSFLQTKILVGRKGI